MAHYHPPASEWDSNEEHPVGDELPFFHGQTSALGSLNNQFPQLQPSASTYTESLNGLHDQFGQAPAIAFSTHGENLETNTHSFGEWTQLLHQPLPLGNSHSAQSSSFSSNILLAPPSFGFTPSVSDQSFDSGASTNSSFAGTPYLRPTAFPQGNETPWNYSQQPQTVQLPQIPDIIPPLALPNATSRRRTRRQPQTSFPCDLCHTVCSRRKDLNRHRARSCKGRRTASQDFYYCTVEDCEYVNERKDKVQSHCQKKHKQPKGRETLEKNHEDVWRFEQVLDEGHLS